MSHNLSNPGIDRIFKITTDSRLYWITSYYYWRVTRLRQVIADGDRNLERLGPLVTTKGGIFTGKPLISNIYKPTVLFALANFTNIFVIYLDFNSV